jgi:hypothetical protein
VTPEQYAERVTTCDEGIEALRKCDRAALERLIAALVRDVMADCARLAALPPHAPAPITGEHRRLWEISAESILARAGP